MRNVSLAIVSISLLLVLSITPSFAQTATSGAATRIKKADLAIIQQRGDLLIQQRLTSLNNMITRINGMNRLSADEKTTLTTNINNSITGLTALKTKLDADTDVTTAKADVKSIYTTYRVYAEFDPQNKLLATSDTLTVAITKLTELSTKLQTRISSASAAGNNVTSLTTLLTDMQSKIADAKTQQASVQTSIGSLRPSSYNTNPTGTRTIFINAHSLMQTARNDLKTALQDARSIIQGLKAFKTSSFPTPTV